MIYTPASIADIVGGRLAGSGNNPEIRRLLTDSRQVIFPEQAAFFALPGRRHDGHRYVGDLYRKGVRCFVVSHTKMAEHCPEADFILVDDTLKALQTLATHHRHLFSFPVIGITGSNGKTIVKEWLFQLLHPDYRIVRSPRSYNSQIGVPLSVWQIRSAHNMGIFEAGISTTGEMERIAPIIDCSIGIFTNIGEAHSEGFSNKEEKLRQKLRLFDKASTVVYCVDQQVVHQAMALLPARKFTWSKEGLQADLSIIKEEKTGNRRTELEALYRGQTLSTVVPFTDPASVENAIHCWSVLLLLGLDSSTIKERMLRLEPVAMRLELREGANGCVLINDSYNSDLTSLAIALHFMQQQSNGQRQTLILSDILQSGQSEAALYAEVSQLLQETGVNRFIGIGTAVEAIAAQAPPELECRIFASTDAFLKEADKLDFQQEVILLKGARQFAFERIAARLSRKVHRTTLEVNLSALLHNLNAYHSLLKPGVKLMVMVKAAAYGSGSLEIARLLAFHKVDYLAVAYADEGVELRRGGIQLPILVLNPEEEAFENMLRYRLEPEVYSLAQIKQLIRYVPEQGPPLLVHVKLDTGMRRLGFEPADLEELALLLQSYPQLRIQSVFSHLAASEASEHDDFTREQIRQFRAGYQMLVDRLGYHPLRHILNTSGISRFPDDQMDMTRLGIGLYGVDSHPEMQSRLKTVLTLKATISQIKNIEPGETVGYGRRGKLDYPAKIATISIGYADGLLRGAGNGRYKVLINGKPAPIVGNVCMDMCMVDISALDNIREGDEVIIFGENPPVQQLATAMQTIPYEVLTGISPRVRRVYLHE